MAALQILMQTELFSEIPNFGTLPLDLCLGVSRELYAIFRAIFQSRFGLVSLSFAFLFNSVQFQG